jgi:hypothetical protein
MPSSRHYFLILLLALCTLGSSPALSRAASQTDVGPAPTDPLIVTLDRSTGVEIGIPAFLAKRSITSEGWGSWQTADERVT